MTPADKLLGQGTVSLRRQASSYDSEHAGRLLVVHLPGRSVKDPERKQRTISPPEHYFKHRARQYHARRHRRPFAGCNLVCHFDRIWKLYKFHHD